MDITRNGETVVKIAPKHVLSMYLVIACIHIYIFEILKKIPGLNLLEMPSVMMTITMKIAIMMVGIVVAEKPITVLNVNVRIQAILTLIQVILSKHKYEGTYLLLCFSK